MGDMQQTTLVVRKYHEPRVPIEAAAAAAIRIISRPAEPETGSKKRKGSLYADPDAVVDGFGEFLAELGLTGSELGLTGGGISPPVAGP